MIVLVSNGDRAHVASAGIRPPNGDQRFRIGSVTKTFTATIVLQLVAERRLRLSDTIERYLPGVVPSGKKITIRELLNHRSGLANFTDNAAWMERASRSPKTRPLDSLRFAATQPLAFPPGTGWMYSNTNYIALGLVIERVTGKTYREELERRILHPLALRRTGLPRTRRLRDLHDQGENPNVPWAAGAIVSSAHDLAHFFSALLSGRLLSKGSLAQMKHAVVIGPESEDGLGIFSTHLACGRFWGHEGEILDYVTLVTASDAGDRVAVISTRGASPGPPPDETALLCPNGTSTSR